jgi:ribosomal protein S18 acetylase RimI-like enzyme
VLLAYQSDPDLCAVATVRDGRTGQDQVVAFAIGTTIEKPRSSWKYGYLVWLGCDPAYQGLGLAKQLYHTLIEAFARENVRMIMVDTQSSNEAALKFFRKLGFDEDKDEDHVYLCNKPSTFFDKSESLDLPVP